MDERLLRQMDACRPGSDDHLLPEMADLNNELTQSPEIQRQFHRLQRLDERLLEALDDVPVPSNLADRLLSALAQPVQSVETTSAATVTTEVEPPTDTTSTPLAETVTAALQSAAEESAEGVRAAASESHEVVAVVAPAATAEPVESAQPARAGERSQYTRRALVWGLLSASALAASLLLVFTGSQPTLDVARVEEEARLRAAELQATPQPWQRSALEDKQQVPSSVRANSQGWQELSFLGQPAVAHQLTRRATLLVIELPNDQRVVETQIPPARPRPATEGYMLATWQSQRTLYVLVVQGGEADYDHLIRQPQPTV